MEKLARSVARKAAREAEVAVGTALLSQASTAGRQVGPRVPQQENDLEDRRTGAQAAAPLSEIVEQSEDEVCYFLYLSIFAGL